MIPSEKKNLIFPSFIGAAVLLIAVTLLIIGARSPYTHVNLDEGFDPTYTRTDQALVGDPVPYTGDGLAVPRANDPVELGKQLFVTTGCASCHGLDGRGGIIGPPIVGTKADKLRPKMLAGPKGMPTFAPNAATDEDVAAIAAYLNAMSK